MQIVFTCYLERIRFCLPKSAQCTYEIPFTNQRNMFLHFLIWNYFYVNISTFKRNQGPYIFSEGP